MSEFIVGARGHDFGRHSVEELLSSIGDAGFRCTQLAYTKAVEGVKSYADVTPELVAATNAAVQKSGVSIAVDKAAHRQPQGSTGSTPSQPG